MIYDDYFRSLGAVAVYDESYPSPRWHHEGRYAHGSQPVRIFARYYFNAEGTEIGYFLPDVSTMPHVHEKPRVWAMPHTLVPF